MSIPYNDGMVRRSESVLIAYLSYAAIVAAILPVHPPVRPLTLVLNLTIVACYALLIHADSLRRREFLSIVRDWFPWPLMLLAYREMGWFALPRYGHPLEAQWVVWDRLVRRALPGLALTHLAVPPPAIRTRLETQYFGLSRSGPCWDHMTQTRQIGVYVPGEFPNPEVEILVVLEN